MNQHNISIGPRLFSPRKALGVCACHAIGTVSLDTVTVIIHKRKIYYITTGGVVHLRDPRKRETKTTRPLSADDWDTRKKKLNDRKTSERNVARGRRSRETGRNESTKGKCVGLGTGEPTGRKRSAHGAEGAPFCICGPAELLPCPAGGLADPFGAPLLFSALPAGG